MRHSRVRPRCCCCPTSRSGDTDSEVTNRLPGAEPRRRPSVSRSALAVGASPPRQLPLTGRGRGLAPQLHTSQLPLEFATHSPTTSGYRQLSLDRTPPLLSRPVEDCAECPALAGVRNLGLDDLCSVVQIHLAISPTGARLSLANRVERAQRVGGRWRHLRRGSGVAASCRYSRVL